MSERIIIRGFAGIKDIDLTISQINVLIGPQATGKSICAKSLYYFKSFLSDLLQAVELEQTKRQLDSEFTHKFQNYFPTQNLSGKDFLLRYQIENEYIQIEQQNSKLRFTYSEYYRKEFASWRTTYKNTLQKSNNEGRTQPRLRVIREIDLAFYNAQAKKLGKVAAFSQVFIPAGRSFFAILQRTIFSFLSSNNAIDPFLTEFGSFYEGIKLMRPTGTLKNEEDKKLKNKIDNLAESILRGKHIIENNKDFLVSADGRKISLSNSSSGQQEMLPLALILGNIPFTLSWGTMGNVVYIEEPEAHLFPTAQSKIVDLIATIYNQSRIPVQFIITTHSPYILTSLNNLLYAGNLSEKLDQAEIEKLEQIVPEDRFLKPEDIQVYSLHNGMCESILSKETGLISTNLLDEVSDELAVQFDNILSLE